MLSPTELLLALLIVFVSSFVQGAVGFGAALIAAPLLSLLDPHLVPGPVTFLGLLLTLLVAVRERQTLDWRGVRWALVGRVFGTLLGAWLLARLSARLLSLTCGALTLLGVAMVSSRLRVALNRTSSLSAGVASGFMGTAASIGGPPVALLYSSSSAATLRGTLAGYFAIGSVMSLCAQALAGHLGPDRWRVTLWLTPAVLAGFLLSSKVVRSHPGASARHAVLALSAASGVLVVVRELWALCTAA